MTTKDKLIELLGYNKGMALGIVFDNIVGMFITGLITMVTCGTFIIIMLDDLVSK